ncbi:MAG TPA: ABC transporter permease subunit [Arachnia sp.]|nr:ABC transporter permease subunit [Arachnia sp.]HMT86403.1 ABC transporter permease subunit [Arachnia sp.]
MTRPAAVVPLEIDLGSPVADGIDWLLIHFGGAFDAIGGAFATFIGSLTGALLALPAWLLILILTAIPVALQRWVLAVFALLALTLVDAMGLWTQTIESLCVVLVATVVATAIGIPLGIWSARSRAVSTVVRPVLDFAQTTPAFVYLIPAVFFFGVGVVPGVVATIVFALAPAVRLTELGIREVDKEIVEAADAFGARPGQTLREVQLPLALPTIAAGVNQVIMLALSMVVVAGMAGAGGLGAVVTRAVTQLDVASGVQGGIAVVILAIYLDRVTSALVKPDPLWRRLAPRGPQVEVGASAPQLAVV